jgi:hypothetical protein
LAVSLREHPIFAWQAQHPTGPAPAHGHDGESAKHCELPERCGVRASPVSDCDSGGGHAQRNEQHKSPSKADARLTSANVFAVSDIVTSILCEICKSAIDSGSAEFVCDEQRLAGCIAG